MDIKPTVDKNILDLRVQTFNNIYTNVTNYIISNNIKLSDKDTQELYHKLCQLSKDVVENLKYV